jgi:hypothetical protein
MPFPLFTHSLFPSLHTSHLPPDRSTLYLISGQPNPFIFPLDIPPSNPCMAHFTSFLPTSPSPFTLTLNFYKLPCAPSVCNHFIITSPRHTQLISFCFPDYRTILPSISHHGLSLLWYTTPHVYRNIDFKAQIWREVRERKKRVGRSFEGAV